MDKILMNEILRKTVAAGLALVVMLVMVITATYAWMTFSVAPETQGIQLSLAGSSTIMIAPDVTRVVNGKIYHYPGKFSQNLNFNQYAQYGFLNSIDGLSPVSTADGVHWFLPTCYDINDEEVVNGLAVAGGLRPINDFYLDTKLEYANLIAPGSSQQGNYVCLDFWVVSPNVDYYLRVAQGDEEEGSYLIELMKPVESASGGNELAETLGSIASSARVGFLINEETVLDDTIMYYAESGNCPSAYTSLRGNYSEIGKDKLAFSEYNFTIYEPNADLHPYGTNGIYTETKPVAWDEGGAYLKDVSDYLCVQLTNGWCEGVSDDYIKETFETATAGKSYSSLSEAESDFYYGYLQGNVASYVTKGNFITYTSALYDAMTGGRVSAEALGVIEQSGATEDVVLVHLEKNIPQRIRMFIWIEGQDSDCVGNLDNVSFALGLELSGSRIDDKTRKFDQ